MGKKRSRSRSRRRSRSPKKSHSRSKIHTGPNGGKYYIKNGRKIYVNSMKYGKNPWGSKDGAPCRDSDQCKSNMCFGGKCTTIKRSAAWGPG